MIEYRLKDSSIPIQDLERIEKIAREYIRKNLNKKHLSTMVGSFTDVLIYFERFNERANQYEGQTEIYTINIRENGQVFIRDIDTSKEYEILKYNDK